MKYFFASLLSSLLLQIGYSQNSQLWKGYFSYKEIKDISQSPTSFFAAAENALFSKNLTTNTLKTTNTIQIEFEGKCELYTIDDHPYDARKGKTESHGNGGTQKNHHIPIILL